jgi:hypothetical protein
MFSFVGCQIATSSVVCVVLLSFLGMGREGTGVDLCGHGRMG